MLQPVQANLQQARAHSLSPCRAHVSLGQHPAGAGGFSGRPDSQVGPARGAAPALPTRHKQRRGAQCNALDPAAADALHAAAASLPHDMLSHGAISQLSEMSQHLSLAYERVTLPCSSMNCGDAIYRRCAAPPFQTVSSRLLQQKAHNSRQF